MVILKSLSFLLRLLAAHPTVRIRIPCISFMLPVSITMDSWAPILFSGGEHVPFIYSEAQILADSASGGRFRLASAPGCHGPSSAYFITSRYKASRTLLLVPPRWESKGCVPGALVAFGVTVFPGLLWRKLGNMSVRLCVWMYTHLLLSIFKHVCLYLFIYVENHEFALMPPILIQCQRFFLSFSLLYICNPLLWQRGSGLPWSVHSVRRYPGHLLTINDDQTRRRCLLTPCGLEPYPGLLPPRSSAPQNVFWIQSGTKGRRMFAFSLSKRSPQLSSELLSVGLSLFVTTCTASSSVSFGSTVLGGI